MPESISINKQSPLHWLAGKFAYSMAFAAVFLLLTGVALFWFTDMGKPPVKIVRIGYGSGGKIRQHFLEQMALHGRRRKLDIRLVPTQSADQTLTFIDNNSADMGLITGAIEDRVARRVFEITPLYMEPLQLLVKQQLFESVRNDIGQLKGKSIFLDSAGSSTALMATELLKFVGLTDRLTGQRQYRPVYISEAQLLRIADASQLPDAIFHVGGVPSLTIRELVSSRNYRFVPLPFGGSFNLDRYEEAAAPDPFASSTLRLNRAFIEEFTVPAFVYSVLPPVPSADNRTIATRLLLVGSDRLDNQLVRRVLELIFSAEISNLAKPPLNVDLLNSDFEFERHPGTDTYVDSLKPFTLEAALESYGQIAKVWGIIAGLYFLAQKALQWWRDRKTPGPLA